MCGTLAHYVRSINTTRADQSNNDRKAMKQHLFEYETEEKESFYKDRNKTLPITKELLYFVISTK
jgi:hypothetical protein